MPDTNQRIEALRWAVSRIMRDAAWVAERKDLALVGGPRVAVPTAYDQERQDCLRNAAILTVVTDELEAAECAE